MFSRSVGKKVQIMSLVKSSYVWAPESFLVYDPHAVRGGAEFITLHGVLWDVSGRSAWEFCSGVGWVVVRTQQWELGWK